MKTNKGLVEYCQVQLGNPYWWGTFGNIASENLLKQKKNQYPKYYTATDFSKQYGKRVHDCVGLIKGYLWSTTPISTPQYNAIQDKDVNGMFTNCSEYGKIDTLPELPGILVFTTGHVGIYIGGGEVIEARGHAYGVVKTKLKERPWNKWGKLNWIKYEEDATQMTKEEKEKVIQEKVGIDDNSIKYLEFYRYSDALIDKLYKALNGGE